MELCSMLCSSLDEGSLRRPDTHKYMVESLHLSPETITTLLIGYTPIQNKMFFKKAYQSGEGNGNPLQHSCLDSPMERGAWWASVHGFIKSWT